jgi:hypothetical protein
MNQFLKTTEARQRLNRLFVVRLDRDLYKRLDAALATDPALSGMSKSEFVRRAMSYALEWWNMGTAGESADRERRGTRF